LKDQEFTYDVFISYSSRDSAVVLPLAERLRSDGLEVWFDSWKIQPGATIADEIQKGVEASRVLLICMSDAYFASEWPALEAHTLPFRDSANAQRRLVPVQIEACKLPEAIAAFRYIDWRDQDQAAYRRILANCRASGGDATDANGSSTPAAGVPSTVLRRQGLFIEAIEFTPDGKYVLSAFGDSTIKMWDVERKKAVSTFKGNQGPVRGLCITPDGKQFISAGDDKTLKIWDMETGSLLHTFEGHEDTINSVRITLDGKKAISSSDDHTLRIWDLEKRSLVGALKGHKSNVRDVAIMPDGIHAVSAAWDNTLKVWHIEKRQLVSSIETGSRYVHCVALSPDGKQALSGSSDRTVKIWNLEDGSLVATLEGHTSQVWDIMVGSDGRHAYSASSDRTARIWDLEEQRLIATLECRYEEVYSVAVTNDGRWLASGSSPGKNKAERAALQLWDLLTLQKAAPIVQTTRYTNAKVCLVGESGVGKSGLALRLAEGRWQETGSTHGMTVAKLDLSPLPNSGMEREVWLWDFAGQPDYRLVHQLYMDETALALMVIDAQRDQPFAPLAYWEQALSRAVRRDPTKLLVAARCDRGGYTIGQRRIDDYMAGRGYAGHVATAAKLHDDPGCATLRTLIAEHIPWDRLPSTSTTQLFRTLKEAVIGIRDSGVVLIRVAELDQRLRLGLENEIFAEAELRTVIGLLAGQGIIQKLDFGDFVLLQPEQINNYGSAVVRAARNCASELAELPEEAVLNGDIDFQDLERLDDVDEKLLLRAMVQTFLDRGLCYRIKPEGGDRLVFPAYFKHDRPELPEQPDVLITYRFAGPVDQIYTTLVVRLNYTNDFEIDHLWRYAGDFKSLGGGRAGLILTKERDDAATIEVFFDDKCSMDSKVSFIKYIHEHLKREANDVTRSRDYVCPNCGTPVENKESVAKKLKEGKKDIVCVECEKRVPLIDLIEQKFASDAFLRNVQEMDREAQFRLDNESLELILIGHAFSTVGEAGHIFRPIPNSDWGIDGEIEFKNSKGQASGQRLYLQLKSGDSYLRRQRDGAEVFQIKNPRHAEYWQAHEYPVMLVIRGSDERIRWMNVTDYLKLHGKGTKRIVFEGETFNAISIYNEWRRAMAHEAATDP